MADTIDRHLSRATETDDMNQRYLSLVRSLRSTIVLVVLSVMLGVVLLAGVTGATAMLAGIPVLGAVGVGLGSAVLGCYTVVRLVRSQRP